MNYEKRIPKYLIRLSNTYYSKMSTWAKNVVTSNVFHPKDKKCGDDSNEKKDPDIEKG